jgi:hypothetical protein
LKGVIVRVSHLSALDDFSAGMLTLDRLTKPRWIKKKTVKAITLIRPRRCGVAACFAKRKGQHRW